MTDRPHVKIKDIQPGSAIAGVYGLQNPQVGNTRMGKPFFKTILRDATGEVPARLWTFDEARLPEVSRTGFAWVTGRSETYQGSIQIILESVEAVEVDAADLVNLLPSTPRSIESMFARVKELLGTLEHPGMRALADAYLGDEALMEGFCRAPAAVSVHHAFIGGLLQHTLQLIELADRMLPLYPELNRDLVLMGLFLHDLGKVWELDWERGFAYTVDGNLVGHIVRGAVVLETKAAVVRRGGADLPREAVRVLMHIVLSHHGLPEHGAAKLPSTPEAIFVAQLDNLDAKTFIAIGQADRGSIRAGVTEFTDRVWSLDTRIYRPDPLNMPANVPAS